MAFCQLYPFQKKNYSTQVTIRTKPGNGHFWSFVKVQGGDPWESPEMTFLNDPFERMDKYGEQARCALESPVKLGSELNFIFHICPFSVKKRKK